MKFSERQNILAVKNVIQYDYIDQSLRTKIWNLLYKSFLANSMYRADVSKCSNWPLLSSIWIEFYNYPFDEIPLDGYKFNTLIKQYILKGQWYQVYDLLEFIISSNPWISEEINEILKQELSAYRVINGIITPISDEHQLKMIEDSLKLTSNIKYKGANTHLNTALAHLSNRSNPDYRNSIKESISAIESIAQVITNMPKATLGNALSQLKKNITIHKALESSFNSLYGYTSDDSGIRHALLEEDSLDQEDALFMLISCSSFIHYLIIKAKKAGIGL